MPGKQQQYAEQKRQYKPRSDLQSTDNFADSGDRAQTAQSHGGGASEESKGAQSNKRPQTQQQRAYGEQGYQQRKYGGGGQQRDYQSDNRQQQPYYKQKGNKQYYQGGNSQGERGGYQQRGGKYGNNQQRGQQHYHHNQNQAQFPGAFNPQQFNLQAMAQMVSQQDIVHHTENLANIDRSELQGLFTQLMQFADTQFDSTTNENGQNQLFSALNQMTQNMSKPRGGNKYQPKKQQDDATAAQQTSQEESSAQTAVDIGVKLQEPNNFTKNLCLEHFPEPIILTYDRPLCKKCIPEYIAKQKGDKGTSAQVPGMNSLALNAFQSEKSQISRCLDRISNFKRDFRNIEQEISEREKASDSYVEDLPPLLNSMFEKLEELVTEAESRFENKIIQIVRNQQQNIEDDINKKLPNFYQRLDQKYQQLQMASNMAQQRGMDELLDTLKHYFTVFTELDAEYEKYFNDYEKMSKLQRLLDQDSNEILNEFSELVEKDLRVDYNIKSSFGNQLPQRLHSFQWNQRCSQIFRIKTGVFEKKHVTMQFEVPLYSRSIATESGTIYLTGGYIKQQNLYLNTCFRYDELFSTMKKVANMHKTHADHSICCVDGFIYVVGTFVNNVVYGYCERYDTQKDKWKEIEPMSVPRTGVSLCSFKGNYIFAFGGRIDQKQIVDTIECYDISRNVWQQIQEPLVDKSKWVPAYMGLAYQITENEILIFGGKSALTFQIFNGCFVFDVEKMQIRERGSLVNPCSFMNTPLVFHRCLYAYGNDIFVHKYDIPEQKWSVIPKTSAVLTRQ